MSATAAPRAARLALPIPLRRFPASPTRCGIARALRAATFALWLGALPSSAGEASPDWPDTPLARTQALALLQTLNADLLSHPSATRVLERWCGAHGMAAPATVLAHRVRGHDKPLPPALRARLAVDAREPVRYRRVRLACGDHVLSEADNWYLPGRLTAAMNHRLDHSDTPFGKVVRPLHFRRETLSARLLWSPLPAGWETRGMPAPAGGGRLAMPHEVLQHRALLYDAAGRPFSALIETYTDQVLAFPPTAAAPRAGGGMAPRSADRASRPKTRISAAGP